MEPKKYVMTPNMEGIRLDKAITEKEGISRAAVQRLIDEGKILVNGKKD